MNATLTEHMWVLIDSKVKHTHLSSGYNTRREEVGEGWRIIKQKFPELNSFSALTEEDFATIKCDLPQIIAQRCLFVIQEMKRVAAAVAALQKQDLQTVGALL
ncbi:hypothetical protein RZS08_29265, partial [Arthrospira platensis SPKY1]|nr:hypothetical protein [Arthrospira platensis SPKY1]